MALTLLLGLGALACFVGLAGLVGLPMGWLILGGRRSWESVDGFFVSRGSIGVIVEMGALVVIAAAGTIGENIWKGLRGKR